MYHSNVCHPNPAPPVPPGSRPDGPQSIHVLQGKSLPDGDREGQLWEHHMANSEEKVRGVQLLKAIGKSWR